MSQIREILLKNELITTKIRKCNSHGVDHINITKVIRYITINKTDLITITLNIVAASVIKAPQLKIVYDSTTFT